MTRKRRPELMLKRLWRWVLMRTRQPRVRAKVRVRVRVRAKVRVRVRARVRVRVRVRAHLVRTSQARVREGRPNTSMAAREARRSPTSPSMAPALLVLSSTPDEL